MKKLKQEEVPFIKESELKLLAQPENNKMRNLAKRNEKNIRMFHVL